MKNVKPFVLLPILFVLYWIIVYWIGCIAEAYNVGGENFLIVISIAIKLCPLIGIVVIGILCFVYKKWFLKYRIIIYLLLVILIIILLFVLYISWKDNHII